MQYLAYSASLTVRFVAMIIQTHVIAVSQSVSITKELVSLNAQIMTSPHSAQMTSISSLTMTTTPVLSHEPQRV